MGISSSKPRIIRTNVCYLFSDIDFVCAYMRCSSQRFNSNLPNMFFVCRPRNGGIFPAPGGNVKGEPKGNQDHLLLAAAMFKVQAVKC